ncbi:hypothetical protein PQO03_13000 [Lentisphaera profundi]|uniref:Uncharacterized protein n=1 Tax=Lentisphaera profundi TaxID=1658616 RepID=A0ABY7W193_9BACT|nr:hypothetical protein [Lentisphaera profundi]WDE98754.1 hypothetical protein PQO03_13000 [Lentisphaera profundi]
MKKLIVCLMSLCYVSFAANEVNKVEAEKLIVSGTFKQTSYGTLFTNEKGEEFMVLKNSHEKIKALLDKEVEMTVKVKQGKHRK